MFTGIVQAVATVAALSDRPGLRSFTLQFPPGFLAGQEIGAISDVAFSFMVHEPSGIIECAIDRSRSSRRRM